MVEMLKREPPVLILYAISGEICGVKWSCVWFMC
jgi:hypothetical protein